MIRNMERSTRGRSGEICGLGHAKKLPGLETVRRGCGCRDGFQGKIHVLPRGIIEWLQMAISFLEELMYILVEVS